MNILKLNDLNFPISVKLEIDNDSEDDDIMCASIPYYNVVACQTRSEIGITIEHLIDNLEIEILKLRDLYFHDISEDELDSKAYELKQRLGEITLD